MGIDVLQTNLTAEQNKEIDYLVDSRLREIGEKEDKKVIDSRTAWHWIPKSFKVFLDLDLETAAQRIIASMTEERLASEDVPRDAGVYARTLQKRLDSEATRFRRLYNVDPYDTGNYDLVVDTGATSAAQTAELILKSYRAWLKK